MEKYEQMNALAHAAKAIIEGPNPDRLGDCWREGCAANDHNRKVYRLAKGVTKGNPYEVGSDDWKAWRDGYAYRDMVNDG